MKKRILTFLLALCMVFTMLPVGVFAAEGETLSVTARPIDKPAEVGQLAQTQGVSAVEDEVYHPTDMVRAIVVLEDESLLEQGYSKTEIAENTTAVAACTLELETQQEAVLRQIDEVVKSMLPEGIAMFSDGPVVEAKYNYTVAVNGMAVEVPYGALSEIRELNGVEDVFVEPQYQVPEDMSDRTTADPYTYATSEAVGAVQTWNAGYQGEGMRIAVIDTGLDLDHPSFAAAPESPSLAKDEIAGVVENLNAARLFRGLSAERVYRSEKVPYAFNYVDRTLDVTHDNDTQGDHGTHVAGIAAANPMENTEVVGVAPDAQLLIMKVFGANGGAYFGDILAALEDSYVLNADVVNLSLGTPAGFSSLTPHIDEIFSRILSSDMVVAIAAGNSTSAAYMNKIGTNKNLTSDPDNGIISSPATYVGATSVASVENGSIRFTYVQLENGEKVAYNDVAATALTSLYWVDTQHRAEYQMIPDYGSAIGFEGMGPTLNEFGERVYGVSIAVIERGVIDFTAKQANAKAAGFDACIVYDNVEGDFLNMFDGGVIPNVFITKAGGAAMQANADENGHGILYISGPDETITVPSTVAGKMSDFSSWGVSPDLQLCPEITAPGGNIYSTLTNGHYGMMSGTSMASPQIAGMSALVLQYLHKEFPNLSEAEMHTVAEALLMSTAVPVLENGSIPYSPRLQGAGSANVEKAVTSPVYLTVDNGLEKTPKVSFGDDDKKTGVYEWTFEMHNMTDEVQEYALEGMALTDQVMEINGLKFMSETSRPLDAKFHFEMVGGSAEEEDNSRLDYNQDGVADFRDVQDFLDAVNGLAEVRPGFDLDENGVENTADVQALYEALLGQRLYTAVPANSTVSVHVTLTLSSADKAYMNANYPNGIYVDAFVRAYALTEGAVDLSLPCVGFYGDWSKAPMVDDCWYYQPKNEQFVNRYPNVLFTDFGSEVFNLGLNPYLNEPYDPVHNVLSPNGDGYNDYIFEIYLGLMRNAKDLNFTWYKNGTVLDDQLYDYALKNYFFPAYGSIPPLVFSEVCRPYNFRNADGTFAVEDLDRVQLVITGKLDDGDDVVDQTITTDVVIDTQAPVLDTDSLVYDYDAATDTRTLSFTVSDNYDIAAVVALTKAGDGYEYIPVTTKRAGMDGETDTITLDVSNYDSVFQIAVCDYGANESYYEISFSGENNYNNGAFYGYRLFSSIKQGENVYLTEGYNGWHSFESANKMLMHTSMFDDNETMVSAAEYVDGYIIGVDEHSTIFTMKSGDWTRTELGKLAAEVIHEFYPGGAEVGDFWVETVEYPALDMALDYTAKTLYVLTDETLTAPGRGGYLLTLDWLTGEVELIGSVTGIKDDKQALTLACDNDGVLYAVDAEYGDLYTIDKETAVATFVGETGYKPMYQQSMTVDHAANKLYWAAYGGYENDAMFYEVDKATGALSNGVLTADNGQMGGLYKPYHGDSTLIPDDAALTGLQMLEKELILKVGDSRKLTCLPVPYYAAMNEDLTWTSSNTDVVRVSNGQIAAMAAGEAVITASVGSLTAACKVTVAAPEGQLYVFDFGTDNSTTNSWLSMNVKFPEQAATVANAGQFVNGITAAAYVDGLVYAYDSLGAFYKLDAKTLTGEMLKPADNKTAVTAMAFSYADGYMYAISFDGQAGFDLCQVNLHTGDLRKVLPDLQYMYGKPLGGMAIDHEGRIYLASGDFDDNAVIYSFKMDEYPGCDPVSADLTGMSCNSFGSLVYSADNEGLFWANELGQLYWLGGEIKVETKEEEWGSFEEKTLLLQPVNLGQIARTLSPNTGNSMNMGLLEIPTVEPERPMIPVEDVSVPESLTVAVGGTYQVGASVEPWSAQYDVKYEMADPAIATVDDHGIVSGVKEGETVLTVAVYNADGTVFGTYEIAVTAIFSDVDIYCFMLTDGAVGGLKWLRANAANPAEFTVEGETDGAVYAAGYYDGTLYAIAPGGEEEGYKNHLMRMDPDTFMVQEVLPVEVSYDIRDMAFDYTTGAMYGIAQGGTIRGSLCQFDLETGEATLLGDTGVELMSLACDAEGQLFVITGEGDLCKIDKYTNELEVISHVDGTGASFFQGLHYDHITGNTYLGTTQLSLVNTKTGEVSPLGFIGGMFMQMTSLYTRPAAEQEPDVPAVIAANGVRVREKAAMVAGDTVALKATILPVSVSEVEGTVTWSSSDESIATVDQNGNVFGVTEGRAIITAAINGHEDTCEVNVLAEPQKFIVYDETGKRWAEVDKETGGLTTILSESTKSPIMSAAYTGETIYAYDKDGYFYEIDPETFERTKLGKGISEMHPTLYVDGQYLEVKPEMTDLSYDPETGHLFGLINGLYDQDGIYEIYSAIVEINLEEGRQSPTTWMEMDIGDVVNIISVCDGMSGMEGTRFHAGNLLVKDGAAYFVDTWWSGILCRVDLTWNESEWMPSCYSGSDPVKMSHVSQYMWGMYYDGRSLVHDPVFDTTYVIHDLGEDDLGNGKIQATLYTINMSNASMQKICDIGKELVISSLIIK